MTMNPSPSTVSDGVWVSQQIVWQIRLQLNSTTCQVDVGQLKTGNVFKRDVSDVAMSDDCIHRCWKSKAYPEHCIFVAPLRTVGSSSSLSRVQWYNSPRLTSSLVNTNDLTHSKTWFWIFCLKAVVVLPINSKWSHLKRLVKLIKLYLSSYQSEHSCLAPSLSRLPTLPSLPCIFSLSTSPAQPPCISWLPNLQQTPC